MAWKTMLENWATWYEMTRLTFIKIKQMMGLFGKPLIILRLGGNKWKNYCLKNDHQLLLYAVKQ